ncbi:glucose-6-phosphate isomerase [Blochmannia endosymbiont of Polyrhachis (Hedomyrma) turneri]|uniref:glucose-6-phosphate isomerase n=1 Tax=Blochmannia endosymbiont of Polyrhachis (Hedomyrma) turneri TaxID=1505596 RepID=UPI00061A613F|nr:glucose-6-phosphate isomerase [Blochmannia endosymbiont of Polyrhachis (Hedomyrma) turneri]AKC60184.1 glucose-6-phosphate isomerase [Blochmannia endosymbiont of Polyrhachis (Hedomyrma) turneri]
MKDINPTTTTAWKELQSHFDNIKDIRMIDLFNQDKDRFSNFSGVFNDEILIDYSKNRLTQETLMKLFALAEECDLRSAIVAMFHGVKINRTENRAVLHIALRNKCNIPIFVDGHDVMPDIHLMLFKMKTFSESIISGAWKGFTGKSITDVVNIGIGGSNLGPYMVTEALKAYKNHLRMHFVSNIDGTHIMETLKSVNVETTLFLIVSKTFLTQETMTNAFTARLWFMEFAKNEQYISKHFIALSSNFTEVGKFGISIDNIFEVWDWVGGRYSLWSAVGLSIVLSVGFECFEQLLLGAHDMDQHFYHMPFEKNFPVILALIGIWYNNFFCVETEAILPYDQYMHRFAAYFQQGNMESNGKSIDRCGNLVTYETGPIVWGEVGTNGQHAFYQLIHQGTKMVPCDFIAPVVSHNPIYDHHVKLLSNFFAQTKALAFGELCDNVKVHQSFKFLDFSDGVVKGFNAKYATPHKICMGNRPSNSILVRKFTPYTLGALIALYEHKIFTQGVIFNIYTFDQWGVELGKRCSDIILQELKSNHMVYMHDSSTNGLINCYKDWRD